MATPSLGQVVEMPNRFHPWEGRERACAQRGAQPAPPGPCAPRPAPRPGPARPRPAPGPGLLSAAGKRPAAPSAAPPGGPRAGRAPDPDPALKSGGPGSEPPPAAPAAPGPPRLSPRPALAPRPCLLLLQKKSPFWFTAFGPPPPPQARGIGPSGARQGPHRPQVTGGWRGQPPGVRPLDGLIRAPGPRPGSRAERPGPRSRLQRRLRSARGTPFHPSEGPTSATLLAPQGG
ncbi:basic proline-rich protein-like [Cervus elaphus]|uniref:basic proline-rich protein-like n=1 Tax=Cervus elaphus TaxID=9860 RepID=UPI001CC2B2FC|nr:basic proline-rich protein-like [Cervus elaphus]